MKSKSEHKKGHFSVPLPKTIWQAFSSIPRDEKHISHTTYETGNKVESQNKEKFLTSENHAFYVGKIIKQNILEKITKILGLKKNKKDENDERGSLYSTEYIATALSYAFQHLQFGDNKQAQFVIGNSLSEIFNGKEDIQAAYSVEEQKRLIYRIAKNKFGKTEDDLEVINLEEIKLHKDLFQTLRNNLDLETGELDVKTALGQQSEDEKLHTSLTIARYLYQATETNAELKDIFKKTLTKRQLASLNDDAPMQYYGLTEVAIRLAEILGERNIHGGANRQGKYDDIILHILKGKHQHFQNLKKLSNLFKDKHFETIHLDTDNNPFKIKSDRIYAWVRLSLFMAIGALATWGVFELGKKHQQVETEKIQALTRAQIRENLPNLYYHLGIAGSINNVTPEERITLFENIQTELKNDLRERYKLTPENCEEIEPLMIQFILKHSEKSHLMNKKTRADIIDQFMIENQIWIKCKGINVQKPYNHMLKYKTDFAKILVSQDNDEEIVISERNHTASILGNTLNSTMLSRIGQISSLEEFTSDYKLYLKNETNSVQIQFQQPLQKRKFFVEKSQNEYTNGTKHIVYSSELAKEAIKALYRSIKRSDTISLYQYRQYFYEIMQKINNPESINSIEYKGDYEIEDSYMLTKIPNYTDSFGEFDYEFALYNQLKKTPDRDYSYKKFLVARKKGETKFTTKTALEAAQIWSQARQ